MMRLRLCAMDVSPPYGRCVVTNGTVYPCGFQATWLWIKELVDAEPDVEYA